MNVKSKNVASASSASASTSSATATAAAAASMSNIAPSWSKVSPLRGDGRGAAFLKVLCLTLLCLSFSFASAQSWPPSGMAGSGTESSPWQITTAAHLEALALYVNAGNGVSTIGKYYKMMNNISLSAYSNWEPIGNATSTKHFRGNFDGNGKIIQNLTINRPTGYYNGVFGYVGGGIILNLGIENCNITGFYETGSLVGYAEAGTIYNCYATGTVTGTANDIGGLAGRGNNIWYCYTSVTVTGANNVGGLAGAAGGGSISECYATGNVTGTDYVGGLVGGTSSVITDSYATGNVTGNTRVGGLVGRSRYAFPTTMWGTVNVITNSYATGNVTGTSSYIGGLAGYLEAVDTHNYDDEIVIRNCVAANNSVSSGNSNTNYTHRIVGYRSDHTDLKYNYANSAMVVKCNGLVVPTPDELNGANGMSKSLTDLKTQSFYTTSGNWSEGIWNFSIIWKICGSNFPIFQWQTCAPIITTTSLPDGTTGTAYSQQLTATGDTPITWTLQSGTLPTGLTLSSAGLISGTPTATGTKTFTVKATNSAGNDTKSLSITINGVPPVITTTTLPNGTTGTAYSQQLTATGSTPITWTKASGNLPTSLTLSSAGLISGTPTVAGTYTFTVKAENSAGSDTKSLSITIIAGSATAPIITTTTLPNGTTGTAYSQQLAATGTTPITWTLQSGTLPTGLALSSSGLISGTPTAAGTYTFTVKATNSAGSDTKSLNITINGVQPVITTTTLPNGTTGTAYSQQLTATGSTPITWTLQSGTLPTGLTLSSSGLISGTPTAAGTSTFTVKATNSVGSDTKQLSITIVAGFVPVTNITNVPTTVSLGAFALTGTVVPTDATNQTIIWSIVNAGATGATLNNGLTVSNDFPNSGSVSDWTLSGVTWVNHTTYGTSLCFATNGSYATMPDLSVEAANMVITVTARYGNYIYLHTSPDGVNYTSQGLFTGSSSVATATKNMPSGTRYVKFVAAPGTINDVYLISLTITGNIPASPTLLNTTATGTATVKATIVNGAATGDYTKDFNITVTNSAIAPVITTTTLSEGLVGAAYSEQLEATGTAPITWTVQSGTLPAGLTLSSEGLISGTPTATGTSTFTVKAANSAGNDTKQLSINVATSAVAPVITTTTLPNGKTGTAYNTQLAATGTAPITWTLASGSLPNGLALSSAGQIAGTPTAAGTFNFTVKATNSAGSNSKTLSITITASTIAPIITTTTLPGGLVGTEYKQQIIATGTTPITFSLQSGSLPNGLTLSSTGVIAGTPTAAGTFNFTVKATNSAGSDTKALSISITNAAIAPTITTNKLPVGTVGTEYSAQLEATGTAPITWSLENGYSLPAGLTLSTTGTISGTPTTAQTSDFAVKATNSAGNNIRMLSIKIENSVEVDELGIENYELWIYPNPTTGVLYIGYEISDMRYETLDVAIFDIYGRKLSQISNLRSQILNQIDLSNLPTGMYFLRITTETGVVVRKIIKN